MPSKTTPDYSSLSAELEAVMTELQREDLDVDAALKHYQRGLALIGELEQYLKTAENKVRKLKASLPEA